MPDDSKPEFKAAQGKHAADIQQRRNLSRLTGLTPNQVRIGLRDAVVISGPVGGNVNAPEGTVPVSQDLPPVPGQAMQFDPRPFGPQVPANPIVVAAPEGEQGTTDSPYLMDNTGGGSLAMDTWPGSAGVGDDSVILEVVVRFDSINSRYIFRRITFPRTLNLLISAEGT